MIMVPFAFLFLPFAVDNASSTEWFPIDVSDPCDPS